MYNRTGHMRTRNTVANKPLVTTTVYQDENQPPAATKIARQIIKPIGKSTAVLQPKNAIEADPKGVITRKRSALGDISNQVHTNDTAAKAAKARVTRRAKPAESEVAIKPVAVKRRRSADLEVQAESVTAGDGKTVAGLKRKDSAVEVFSQEDTTAEFTEIVPVAKKAKTQAWDDLDAEDADDPLMVAEYVNEIFDYMRHLEIKLLPNPKYMDQQKELTWKMRSILVDWLIEVHNKFRLLGETLFLTINMIDRFLSLRTVSLVKLQLVGITCMFSAAKYEEIMSPSVHNFIFMTDGGFTEDEVLEAERYLLQVLDFDLSYPNPLNFLRRVSKADNYDMQTRTLAKYLMDISLVDHRFLGCPPSMLAAAGVYLARQMLNRGPWDANLTHYSGYSKEEVLPCVQLMINYLAQPIRHENFFKKYANKKLMKASLFSREWVTTAYPDLVLSLNQGSADSNAETAVESDSRGVEPHTTAVAHVSDGAY